MKHKFFIFLLLLLIDINYVYNQRYLKNLNPNLFSHYGSGSGDVKTFTKTKSVKTGGSPNYNAHAGMGHYGLGQGTTGFNMGFSGMPSYLHTVERDTKSGANYKGGCISAPKAPLNSGIKCSQYSGCRANCIQNYQFPNGETQLFITCENGEWQVKGTEWKDIPPCEPICFPQCQNNGICIAPNQCHCSDHYNGPQCQYENKPCLNLPPMPMNSKRACRSSSCTVTCMDGHKFPDGSSIANMICKGGSWVPAREDWKSIPDCAATCTPPCQNGGICLSFNVCQCPTDFRGSQCQYSTEACHSRKLMFNGGYNCSGNGEMYSCSLNCPEGISFEFQPAPVYTCRYSTGQFLPSPIPQCVFDDNMQVINMGGQPHTTYEIINKTSGQGLHTGNIGGFTNINIGDYTKDSPNYYDVTRIPTDNTDILAASTGLEFGDHRRHPIGADDAKPGSCFTWGGTHFKTFDGKVFSFESKCAHTLVRDAADNTFSIVVQNNPDCDKYSHACNRIIKIYLHDEGYTLRISENGVPTFASRKKILPIPGRLPGIRLDVAAHYIIVSLDTIGANVKWDGQYMVQVEVKENLWNRTSGLCGRFDGNFNNDMLTKDGSHPKGVVTLATSWQVATLGETCNSIPSEEHVCPDNKIKGAKGTKGTQFCKKLLSDKRFAPCRHIMDTSLLLDTCRWDYCSCKNPDPTTCACNTLNVYVRECSHKGITKVANWRDENTCPMQCTGGRVYMTCGPKEGQEVCGASVEKTEGDQCEEGCYCPPGTVLHENQCITRDKCPCKFRGKSFIAGSTIPKDCNTCTCADGQWLCTQVNCGARCSAIGDPHYLTFDGKRYDFMGQCSYYLMSTDNVTIEAENVPCAGSISKAMNFPVSISNSLPSCTKAVIIKLNGHVIKLKQNQEIVVNGHELEKIPHLIDGIIIRSVSSVFIVVELPDGVEVWWDGITRVYVDVPPHYKGKTKGLCGTFNENQKDDFLTPEDDIEQSVIPFANKWKTNEKCVDLPDVVKSHPCDINVQNKGKAEEHCQKIKSTIFADCHWMVDPEPYYQDCLYDMCSCETKLSQCLCPMIAAYAQECALKGVKVDWRDDIKECGIHCPGGQKYQVCGNSCTRTCYDITTRPDCKQHCVEGCNCPDGEALDEHGECIPIGRCECQYEGIQFPAGYKEVRPASKGLELCTCMNALWNCRKALPTDPDDYPRANDIKGKCNVFDNYEFTTCEPVEPKTCKNMHSYHPSSNRVCHPGCKCKPGHVLDIKTKKCIKPKDCPCHHGGKSYKEGYIVQHDCNTCSCSKGKWKCTDRPCTSECSAWGDSHFKTFDGKLYDYQGQCDYVLAKGSLGSESFDVTIQNVPCGSLGVACSKSVTIKMGDESITLTRGKHIPEYQLLKRMTVREKDLFVIVEAPDLGIIVHWDKGTRVYIKLDPRWKNKVKGLCGNYNDNEMDDFQTPSGGITEVSTRLFGDSWKLQSYCPDALEIEDTCDERPDRRIWALKKCGVMKSEVFAPCHSEVPVENYFDRCVFDSCACDQGGDCECLCTALAAYAQECNSKGVPIKWRSQELCPIQCDEHCAKYSPCVSTCPIETCENLLIQNPLNKLCKEDVCIEGCQPKLCPTDHVFLNSSLSDCVPKNICKPLCLQIDDTTYFEGDLIEEDNCHTCYCSRGKKVCKGSACTTTLPPTTEPGQLEQLTQCKPGWSSWINQDVTPSKRLSEDLLKQTDIEPIPATIILNNFTENGRCTADQMVSIECRTVKDHIPAKDTGLDVECSLEKGLICNSKNGNKECEDFEIRVLCSCDIVEVMDSLGQTNCPPGQIYDDCAIDCENLCSFYSYIIKHKGMCKNNTQCQSACVSELKKKSCPYGSKWANDHTCVKEHDCVCTLPTGVPVKPGTIYKPDDCEICQCIDNEITCDNSACDENHISVLAPTEESVDADSVYDQIDSTIYNNKSEIVVVSTMTPPPLCDEDRYIDLVQGDQPLPDEAFTASSSLGKLYSPHNAKFGSSLSEKSAGSWSPSKSNKRQYLDINLGRVEPVYGVVVKGSPLYNDYVTSYYVLYSEDGSTFHVIHGKNKKPKKIRGSNDAKNPVKVMFDTPIEAKIIRINPRTWNNAIALKVELIGCGELMTTTTTPRPIVCTDPMGLGDGMMADQQVSVSSELAPKVAKENIIIDGPSAWQPLSNTPTEWIQFNFMEPRNITGVVTQGGPKGWVKTYKVSYSSNGDQWNPIVDENQNAKVFLGNIDKNTPQTNYFYLPIQTTYLKVTPLKWEKNIQMRIEPHGCFEPYPTVPDSMLLTTVSPCNYCPGVELVQMELDACRCSDDSYWDGENCVPRTLCPCMVGHISYAVGTIYEKEDCSQCVCKIGGVSYCTPKACDKCEKGLRSVVTSTCGCICQPCEETTTLCPTSNICINSTLWCNGVQDCPDDEINCMTTTEAQIEIVAPSEVSTPKPELTCPPMACPPGYKVHEKKIDKRKRLYLTTMFSSKNVKATFEYTPTKTAGVKGTYRKTLKKPLLAAKEDKVVSKECPQFQCVSVRPPPGLYQEAKPCPPVKCPPGYIPEYNKLDMAKKHNCPKYECRPPTLPDVICNVTGRSFNTFDKTEYKYDICNHVLARDLEHDIWDISLKKTCDDAKICARDLIIQHEDHIIELHPDLTVHYDRFKYTVDQTKKIGSHSKAFSVSRLGDMLLFVSNRYGFWVIWNKQGNVKIGVTQKLITKVDGLCGYYNDNSDDDKRKPDGTPGRTTVEFGDSWALGDQPAICEAKVCPMHIQNKAWDMCNQVKNDVFSPCASVVDIEAFVSRCLETACACLESAERNKTTDDQCRCQTLTNFVTDCLTADNELELLDWRTQQDCPVECNAPLIHHDCYRRKCEPTCGTIGDADACPKLSNVCFPGCYCPPGYVRKGETCIKSSDCRDCECNVLPHLQYVTYDETNFTINGNCVYVMSRDVVSTTNFQHKFQVLITNHPCEDKPNKMCVGKVTILYNGHKIHVIRHDFGYKLQMIVDSELIDNFNEINDWVRVQVTASKHLKIYFDPVQVQVNVYYPSLGTSVKSPSHKYKGKLEGLCGDCNKDVTNDLAMPNGKIAEDVDKLAISWLFEGVIGQNTNVCSNKQKPQCDFNIDNDPCLILRDAGRFGQCHPLLDPSMFIEWCENDVCGSEVNQACNAISAYARECLNAGFCVQWHSDLCPAKSCPSGQVFEQCGSSCPKTCQSLKDDRKPCKQIPTEGCFCPDGQYLMNGTCVEEKHCEVCDDAGHHPGDIWKVDACTTCMCKATTLICEAVSCPTIETVCEPGFTPVKVSAEKDECCDKYICVPAATISPTCEAPQKLNCAPGQVMKLDTKPDGCKQFICQCIPIDECEPVDLTPPAEDGMVKEIDRTGCCPEEKLVCKPELCSAPDECPMFYDLKNTTIPGKCCPIYQCQAPDKCIFDSEYTASEQGGERLKNQYERQKLLKAGNETWKDGPCRECKCVGDRNKGYHSSCSVQECPDINSIRDAKDFVLKPEYTLNQCCPNIRRVACIDDGKMYEVGQKWHPKDDFCTTVECLSTNTGLQKNLKVTTCDTTCEPGWEYVPAGSLSMECCGSCKQIACVCEGKIRKIGEEWSSPDSCTNYVCISVNGTLQVQAMVVNCPEISKELLKEFVYETKGVEGKCCKEHKVVACKVGQTEYKVGETWPSPDGDLCKKITCVQNHLEEITKQEIVETCNKNCSKGWEYKELKQTCCGECVQVACVVNDELRNPGENWTSPDTCTTFTCEETEDHQFSVSSFYESCPNVDDCPEENIYTKGCCQYCNVTSLPMTNCVPQDIEAAKTVGLVKISDIKHGVCVNTEPIKGFTECVGNCHSSTYFNAKSGMHESVCSCCRATKYEPLVIELDCENGQKLEKQIAMPSKCSCEGCVAQRSSKTHYIKSGVKTG